MATFQVSSGSLTGRVIVEPGGPDNSLPTPPAYVDNTLPSPPPGIWPPPNRPITPLPPGFPGRPGAVWPPLWSPDPGYGQGHPRPPGYASGQPVPPGYASGQPVPPGYASGQPVPPGYASGQPVPPGYASGQPVPPPPGGEVDNTLPGEGEVDNTLPGGGEVDNTLPSGGGGSGGRPSQDLPSQKHLVAIVDISASGSYRVIGYTVVDPSLDFWGGGSQPAIDNSLPSGRPPVATQPPLPPTPEPKA